MFRFLQNHLQANVNHREVHSVCTYIIGTHSVYIKIIIIIIIYFKERILTYVSYFMANKRHTYVCLLLAIKYTLLYTLNLNF